MPLSALQRWLEEQGASPRRIGAHGDLSITGITLSTQRVQPGDVYVGLRGARVHGATFAAQATAAGALAVVTDEAGADLLPADLPGLVVADPRALLGGLSAFVYGRPGAGMTLIGVTGTQGKTTTTRMLEGGLQEAGVTAAVVGTVGTRIAGADVETLLTTPEAPDLHALFAVMRDHAVSVCAMEVSSHALVMGRVDGVCFDVAAFTNLGRDHLDFHHDVEDYYRAKAALFTPERARRAVIMIDDEHGRRLAAEATVPVQTVSLTGRADWRVSDLDLAAEGSTAVLTGPDALRIPLRVPLPGDFNVANAAVAVASAGAAGLDPSAVAAGIADGGGVPGRLERIEAGQDFTVVVDYAHKPDAVQAALETLRPLTAGRLLVVLGAGGDRDPGKRPLMGEVASRLADVLVVTDDNPRSEPPAAIRAAVLAGCTGSAAVHEVGDRREAIRTALGLATAGDIVLVAGKGHETGQEVGGTVLPFDDRQVVREELTR